MNYIPHIFRPKKKKINLFELKMSICVFVCMVKNLMTTFQDEIFYFAEELIYRRKYKYGVAFIAQKLRELKQQ